MRRDNNGKPIFDNLETDKPDTLKHIGNKDELYASVQKDPDSGKWGFDIFSNRPVASSLAIFDTEKDARSFIKNDVAEISKSK